MFEPADEAQLLAVAARPLVGLAQRRVERGECPVQFIARRLCEHRGQQRFDLYVMRLEWNAGSAREDQQLAHHVLATEVDPGALAWARPNAERHGVELLAGDLDAPLPPGLAGRVDVLCANVPDVPSGAIATMPRDVRDHEPRLALDGGPDGLDVLRRLAARAGHWLAPGGWLFCEIGEDQAEAAAALLTAAGLAEVAVHPDLVGRDRIVEGARP